MRECQHADTRWTTGTASCTATNTIFRLASSDLLSSQQVQFRVDGRHNLAGSVLINKSAGVQWEFRQLHFGSEVGHGGCVETRIAESGATRAKYAHNKALSTGSVLPGRQHFCDCVPCRTSARRASRQVEELKFMWMRSCAICKAVLKKLRVIDSITCKCGWEWRG
jgi:hypothetical protein